MDKMNSEYLKNYAWIYAHANDLNQGMVFDSFEVAAIKDTIWRWSNKLGLRFFFSLKTLRLAALRRLGSSLFHSMTVDWKEKFLEKLCYEIK